ncbi:MAG: NAD(+) kinase [Gammaproteobacteria bacterium]|nr:NAD(+) kinase [Gammaproteobacteria bacterium]
MFKRVGLIAKTGDARIPDTLQTLLSFLKRRRLEVFLDKSCAQLLEAPLLTVTETFVGYPIDLVIAVGGDGTLLRAAHQISNHKVRLLGINVGHLGFLADISPEEIPERLDAIFDGQFVEEERMLLQSYVIRAGKTLYAQDAVNDVLVHKWNIGRLITLDIYVNEQFVHRQRSDGIIVSTPTGSTAYALSCGGPILHPAIDALALVPLCPHTLSNRPIVLNGTSRVEIVVGTREAGQARLTCDGEIGCELIPADRVVVEKAERAIRLVHPEGHDHFATLRAKLQWG